MLNYKNAAILVYHLPSMLTVIIRALPIIPVINLVIDWTQ